MKRLLALVLAALLALSVVTFALAATSVEKGGETYSGDSELYRVLDFKFHEYKYGIGYGSLPVYTAPSLNAYRCANGKATIDTNDDMFIGGFDATGWLMVRYETNNGAVRVGYVQPDKVRGFKTDIDTLEFSYIPQVAQGRISLTDDPMLISAPFAMLDAGETYYILGKYTYYGNWWYIECTVDGKVARGFINRDTTLVNNGSGVYTTNLGAPPVSPLGTDQMGIVTVQGTAKIVRRNAGTEFEMVARVNGSEQYPAYASKIGTNGNTWYYIYVDGVWGWISSASVRFQ